eukprot:CAMPEP_0114112488 /NCGR_PEP_ID=MMETSP0043_2-20121206/2413_1 /TAXON_ID=464988 /ORGANISM="Hemiselmis andersenii, Strain CCMP644" /LENGTH=300 /DNA_ID=CAMNT_0001204589 /DNA_START=52 /DNA_END=954 /DNA_ORIENTATION=-
MRFAITVLFVLGLMGAEAFSPVSPGLGLRRPQRLASVGPSQIHGASGAAIPFAPRKSVPRMSLADEQGGDQVASGGEATPSSCSYAWTKLSQCLSDHYQTTRSIPSIMKGALVLSPSEVETTHLTVNSVFSCPFCTGLHGELGRMSDLGEKSYDLNSADSLDSCLQATPHTGVARYARDFATKGRYDSGDYEQLSSSIGPSRASSVRGLAWFLRWGAFGGNTILSTTKSPSLFKLFFTLYYLPLYAIIKAFSAMLTVFPTKSPKILSQAIGLLLPVIAGVWIVPLGLVGGLAKGWGLIEH